MHRFRPSDGLVVLVAVFVLITGCGGTAPVASGDEEADVPAGPRVVQPGAPGQTARAIDPSTVSDRPRIDHTEADVRFMQDMIHHHAQAVEMGALVAERTENPSIRMLAHRIEVSQDDEMALMSNWLSERGETVPRIHPTLPETEGNVHHGHHDMHHDHHDHHSPGAHAAHQDMPGMLTQEQMQQLADASADEFDRLFLEFMIMHHEGALIMVEQLFNREGAGQETDIFSFASHVDSDQRIEILRMRRMLDAINQPAHN